MENLTLLQRLERLLTYKKSKKFYAEKLGITESEVNDLMDELRVKSQSPDLEELSEELQEEIKRYNQDKGTFESVVVASFAPKNDRELAELHKVDLEKYKISSYWTKQRGDKFTSSLLCTLRKPSEINPETFASYLKGYKSTYKPLKLVKSDVGQSVDVEISLADFHLDKLDINAETIEDRKNQYMSILSGLLEDISKFNVGKIAFIIGNDLFHTDTIQGTTTNGTPLDISTTWYNAYEEGFDLMVSAISLIKSYCDYLEVILIQGNHARTKEYYLAHALAVYFSPDDDIIFDREHSIVKSTILGNTFVGYHHGNTKIEDLPLTFATSAETSREFGSCPYREVHTGDKHFYLVKEIKGVRVQQIPSLAGTDAWHRDNGFINNIRAGLALVYSPTTGKRAEFEGRI